MTQPDGVRSRIPTTTGIDHVAYNVPDLAQALDFFTRILGCELLAHEPPHEMSGRPGVRLATAVVRFDERMNFELLAFETDGERGPIPAMTAPWGYHLALTVTDIPAAVTWLQERLDPRIQEAPPLANGRRRAFFTTPWGMTIQIIEPATTSIF